MTSTAPTENQAMARKALNRATGISPATDLYRDLVLTAIAYTLSDISDAMAALTDHLEPPHIPGLPPGYKLETVQAEKNNRLWGYVVTAPDGRVIRSRFQWGYSETALKQGIRHAAIDWPQRATEGSPDHHDQGTGASGGIPASQAGGQLHPARSPAGYVRPLLQHPPDGGLDSNLVRS